MKGVELINKRMKIVAKFKLRDDDQDMEKVES